MDGITTTFHKQYFHRVRTILHNLVFNLKPSYLCANNIGNTSEKKIVKVCCVIPPLIWLKRKVKIRLWIVFVWKLLIQNIYFDRKTIIMDFHSWSFRVYKSPPSSTKQTVRRFGELALINHTQLWAKINYVIYCA